MGATEASGTETVARAYFDAVSARNLNTMVDCWESGSRDVLHGLADLSVPDDLRAWFGALFAAFPDFHFEVLEVISSGEKAAVRWHATGTFDGVGKFEGLVPNGRSVDLEGCDVLTVRDGRVVHNDAYMNGAEMARQLGALPPVGSPPEQALSGLLNAKTKAEKAIAARRSRN